MGIFNKIFKRGGYAEAGADATNNLPRPNNGIDIKQENVRQVYGLYTEEFSALTSDNLKYYFEAKRKGLNFWMGLLFDEIRRRDTQIGGVCQTRKLAVVNKEWEIQFSPETKVPEMQREEIINFLKENFARINVANFLSDTVEAQLSGVVIFENIFTPINNKIQLDKVAVIPNHLLCYDDLKDEYRFLNPDNADVMKLKMKNWSAYEDRIDLSGMIYEEIHPYKILTVSSLDGNATNGFMNGCRDSLVWSYFFKNYGLKDWSVFVERFAIPPIIATRPSFMNKGDVANLVTAVANFGHLFNAVVPEGVKFEFPTESNKTGTNDVFRNYIDYWNDQIAIRVLGQVLTTNVGDKGSRALGEVHNAVRDDIRYADMLTAKDAMNELVRRLCKMNWPSLAEVPEFGFKEEINIEYKAKRSEIIRNLYESGWQTGQEDIEKEFDLKVEPRITETAPMPGFVQKFIEENFNE